MIQEQINIGDILEVQYINFVESFKQGKEIKYKRKIMIIEPLEPEIDYYKVLNIGNENNRGIEKIILPELFKVISKGR